MAQAEAGLEEARANVAQARAQVRSQIARARGAYYQPEERPGDLARADRHPPRPGRHAQGPRVEPMARRGRSAADREPGEARLGHPVRARPAEQHPEGGHRAGEGGLGGDPGDPRPARPAARSTRIRSNIPKDLENQQSTVQSAVSEIASSLAEVGIPFDPKDAAQARAFEDFLRPEGDKSAGEGLEKVVEAAPAVKVALAAVARAEKQLDDARLRLRWTEVRSEIAGYVQDRQANPGNRVEPGQTLLSIRPTYVWVAANYKETQIDDIRIGMPVDLHVDAYPHRVFHGTGRGLQPRDGPVAVAPAARERHGQLREGHPAPAGADRADRAEPGRHAAVRRAVGRAARPVSRSGRPGRVPGSGCTPTGGCGRPTSAAGRPDRSRGTGRAPRSRPGHERGIRRRPGDGQGPKVRAPVNHWIVALTVTLATFMEVLDTSIANVALPYISGGLSVGRSQCDLGADQLPRRQRDRAAALRLADGAHRPQAVLHDLRAAVHDQLGPLRRGAEHRAADPLPGAPGARRRRTPAVRAGHPGRHLPAPATGHGDGHVRRGGRRRADPRARPGRLHQRQLLLALDLLHQHPHRHRLADPDQHHRPGPAGDGRGGPEELEARPQDRLRRPGPGLDRAGLARGPLRQGPGMGLVRRPVLAGPDLLHRDGDRAGRVRRSGSCGTPTRWSTSACWASGTSSPAG